MTYTNADGHQCEDAGGHGEDGDKIAYFAIHFTKRPVAVKHVNEIFKHVK